MDARSHARRSDRPSRPAVASPPAEPDVTEVTVHESPTGGQVPQGATTPPASTPARTPDAAAPSASSQEPDTQAVAVESSSVGSGAVTGAPSDDVVSVLVE